MINSISLKDKHLEIILKIFGHNKVDIVKLDKLPKEADYFRFSFGYQLEREYVYKVSFKDEVYLVLLVTLLNVVVVQKLIFKRQGNKIIQISTSDIYV